MAEQPRADDDEPTALPEVTVPPWLRSGPAPGAPVPAPDAMPAGPGEGRDGTAGTLTPGAPATFARWQTGELAVVAADDAVQRWSTDPRSGVPPMPDLSGPDPVLRWLVVDGEPAGPAE